MRGLETSKYRLVLKREMGVSRKNRGKVTRRWSSLVMEGDLPQGLEEREKVVHIQRERRVVVLRVRSPFSFEVSSR